MPSNSLPKTNPPRSSTLVDNRRSAAELRARRISAVELAQESLRRIRESQPRLNAFITITEDLALEQARRADEDLARGIDRGPLHGIPYGLKDLFATRGIRTTCGSKIFAERITDSDSGVYRKLTEAGAVLMGKTGMHEFAYGITNNHPHFGAVRNPHDPERIPGGSSGGSGAAVAADLVFFAMGTDTGGSIRVPASWPLAKLHGHLIGGQVDLWCCAQRQPDASGSSRPMDE